MPPAAMAATARPITNAHLKSLPGSRSARPSAPRHNAADGLMEGKPAPQLVSSSGPIDPPMSTAPAIITAAKPAI